MITLPDNWKDGIQITSLHTDFNQLGFIGSMELVVENEHKQQWGYHQSIVVPGIEKYIVTDRLKAEKFVEDKIKEAYLSMIVSIPEEAKKVDSAYVISDHVIMREPIYNNIWHNMVFPDLLVYKP